MNRYKICLAPEFISRKAFDDEMRENWPDCFVVVLMSSLPPGASTIEFHTALKMKDEGDFLMLKERRVLPLWKQEQSALRRPPRLLFCRPFCDQTSIIPQCSPRIIL